MRVMAFADHALRVRDHEPLGEVGATRALHAVIGPQHLLTVVEPDRRKRHLAMRRSERDVARRVPVLRQQDVVEARSETVDNGDDFVAALDRQLTARQEVVLDIDDQQQRVRAHQPTALPISSTTFFASPNTIIVFGM